MKNLQLFDINKISIINYLKTIEINTPAITFCDWFDETSNIWNLTEHKHSFTEFIYILDGNMEIDMPDKRIFKHPYNLVVYPKNVIHKEFLNLNEHQQIICIGIATKEPCALNTAIEIDDKDGVVRWLMGEIYLEYSNKREHSDEIIKKYVELLFLHILRYYESIDEKDFDFVSKCICYIRDHFAEELSIEKLASVAFVSSSHLTRSFRKRTGLSPIEYVRNYRLSIAQHELLTSKTSIEEIAALSGFKDSKYFSRYFKSETGLTPRDYRRKSHTMVE